ncbi:MAG: 6-bladed beta-propeller [Methanobacteriota archaeon]|nr:MAG: 6-bladed beta-propeller [Euryarchaeota archaeon]
MDYRVYFPSRVFFLIVFLAMAIGGCKSDPENESRINENKTNIEGEEAIILEISEDDFQYSKVFKSFTLKTFQVPEDIIIAEINQYYAYGGFEILVDEPSKSIFLFSNGSLLKHIHNVGNGPTEYRDIMDTALDSRRGILAIYDGYSIVLYQLPDFTFVAKWSDASYRFGEIIYHNGYFYAFRTVPQFSNHPGFLIKIDPESGKELVVMADFPKVYEFVHQSGTGTLVSHNRSLYFAPPLMPYIVVFDSSDAIQSQYVFAHSKLIPDYDNLLQSKTVDREKLWTEVTQNFTGFSHLQVSGDLIYMNAGIRQLGHRGLYKKGANKVLFNKAVKNDIPGTGGVLGNFVPNNVGMHIESVHPEDVAGMIGMFTELKEKYGPLASLLVKNRLPELEQLYAKIKDYNSPVLFCYAF